MGRLGILGTFAVLGAMLYGAISLSANPGTDVELTAENRATLKELATGEMAKLVIHREARPRIEETFFDQYGNPIALADYAGKVVVLNYWATWCPPCRAEMPSLDRLASAMAGGDVEVLALSTDRFDIERVVDFFKEIGIENLRVLHDRKGTVARRAGVLGLPVTAILDRHGREIARMQGEAAWDSAEARAMLTRIVEMTAPAI